MISLLPVPLIAALFVPTQAAQDDPRAAAIAPFIGGEVAAVLHVDLTAIDVDVIAGRVLSGVLAPREIDDATRGLVTWTGALREAGAESFYLLVDPADFPGLPTAVVPLAEGADAEAIGRILCGGDGEPSPVFTWPTCATVRGVVFAGTDAALDRIRRPDHATPRPGLAAAFAASGDAPARVVFIPSEDQRRVVEEMLPTLPESFGPAPITPLTRGLRWAALVLEAEPRAALRVVVQARDDAAARDLGGLAQKALAVVQQSLRDDEEVRELVGDLGQITSEVAGDRLVLAVDLEQASALVGVPVRRARESARRAQCTNNLKYIALAMHNYHDRHKSFPPAYTADADGTPLLSWRIQLLPFLEQQSLYDQFHLDEPWDSPHNKALIGRMPEVFRCPSAGLTEDGMTTYLAPRGEGTIFPGARGVPIKEVTDGSSNTILVVDADADRAVIWTKPDDWEVGDPIDAGALFGNHPGGTNAALADGSVRFFREAIDPDVLRRLTTRSGGETIRFEDL